MPETQKVTEEQANEALRSIMTQHDPEEPAAAPEPGPEPSEAAAAEPEPKVEEPSPEAPEVQEQAASGADDVESLKKRLTELESAREASAKSERERAEAMQKRFAQNEAILRDRFLRKATVADRAHKILKQSRSESGVPEAEVDALIREIEATMNPASGSYSAPIPTAQEDQVLGLNRFLNEKVMSSDEAAEFARWMQTQASTAMSPYELEVAGRDLDGFLRLAHTRFLEGQREKDKQQRREEAVGAVRSVQRTQREAARAASAAPVAPRKPPVAPSKEVDVKKFTKDDVSRLLRQSVEQYYAD